MPIGRNFKLKRTDNRLLDLDISDGDFQVVKDTDEVEQSIEVRLMKRKGEDPIDPNIGLPWPEIIRMGRDEYLSGMVHRALSHERRVASVDEVIVEQDPNEPRTRFVDVDATLIDGSRATPQTAFGS